MTDLVDMIFFHADANPDKPAVITGEAILTYRMLRRGILSVQQRLRRHGLKAGDHVAIHVTSAIAHVTLICALHRSGIASVSLDLSQGEFLEDLAVDAVLTNFPDTKGSTRIIAIDNAWFEEKTIDNSMPNSALARDDDSPCRLICRREPPAVRRSFV